jgi:acetolactate synthase I/II/III large subunit
VKVAEAVARALVAEGAEIVFSLLGDTNMEVVVRLAELGLPVHEARHEAAAMAMADGYARATGKVAICSVTAGPGFAHTFVPLTSASRRTPSPVVVLTGPHSRDDLENRQHLDHEGLTRLSGAHYRPIAAPGVAVERAHSVMDLARSQGRPVVLDVPADIQAMDYPWEVDDRPAPSWHRPQRMHADPEAVASAADLLRAAERPVVLAGGGAASAEARAELAGLAEATGALLATSINARGLFHGDPFNAGVAGLFSIPAAHELFATADCVVAFGASMNAHTTENGYLFPEARFVQVDVKPPAPMEGGPSADCYVRGDAVVVARALRDALSDAPRPDGFRTDEVLKALAADVDPAVFDVGPAEIDPRALCSQLDDLLPEECGFVSGAAHYWSFPQLHMVRWRQPLLYASYAGSIGYSIPVALGAALGSRRPIVVFEGDGGFLMNPHVLETAASAGAPLLVVLMNDGALGAEYHKLRAKELDPTLALHPRRDLAAIAAQLGCRSAVLTDLDQLPRMVEEFTAGEGPFVIDARISRNVVSQPYRRTHFGIG